MSSFEPSNSDDEIEIISKLKYYITEFEKLKNSRDDVSKFYVRIANFQKYINTINFNKLNQHQLSTSIDYLSNAVSLNIDLPKSSKETVYAHIDEAIDALTEMILFLIENPTIKLGKKKFIQKQKRSILQKLFGTKLENKQQPLNESETDEELLEIDVDRNEFQGIMNIFISHKFMKSDQELATHLEKLLKEKNLYGYIAERKKEYEKPLSDKIKSRIDDSHYLVAILTKYSVDSPSVHQEIGYAIGTKTPVLIMAEKGEVSGVLVQGYEHEEFTRQNFQKACTNIVDYIVDHDKPLKISDKEKHELIQNVYEPCYNQMKNEYNGREFITTIPPDPWKTKISNTWKLKTEPEMRQLFEDYSKELQVWHRMWVDFGNNFQSKKNKLGEIIRPAFRDSGILNEDGNIPLSESSYIEMGSFLENFRDVIFDDTIYTGEQMYDVLINYAKHWQRGLVILLEKWQKENPIIFSEMPKYIPDLISGLELNYSSEQYKNQRKILKESIEKLTLALEEKLK